MLIIAWIRNKEKAQKVIDSLIQEWFPKKHLARKNKMRMKKLSPEAIE